MHMCPMNAQTEPAGLHSTSPVTVPRSQWPIEVVPAPAYQVVKQENVPVADAEISERAIPPENRQLLHEDLEQLIKAELPPSQVLINRIEQNVNEETHDFEFQSSQSHPHQATADKAAGILPYLDAKGELILPEYADLITLDDCRRYGPASNSEVHPIPPVLVNDETLLILTWDVKCSQLRQAPLSHDVMSKILLNNCVLQPRPFHAVRQSVKSARAALVEARERRRAEKAVPDTHVVPAADNEDTRSFRESQLASTSKTTVKYESVEQKPRPDGNGQKPPDLMMRLGPSLQHAKPSPPVSGAPAQVSEPFHEEPSPKLVSPTQSALPANQGGAKLLQRRLISYDEFLELDRLYGAGLSPVEFCKSLIYHGVFTADDDVPYQRYKVYEYRARKHRVEWMLPLIDARGDFVFSDEADFMTIEACSKTAIDLTKDAEPVTGTHLRNRRLYGDAAERIILEWDVGCADLLHHSLSQEQLAYVLLSNGRLQDHTASGIGQMINRIRQAFRQAQTIWENQRANAA